MNWAFFAFLAAFLWACCNIIDKIVLSKFVKRPMTSIIIYAIFGLLAVLAIALTQNLDNFSLNEWGLSLLSGTALTMMSISYSYAIRKEDVSRLIPLFGLAPVFIAIVAALFLNEVFPFYKYIAIFLILVGAITISTGKIRGFRFNRAFWLMILAAACVACAEITSKYLLQTHDFWSVFVYMRIGVILSVIPFAAKDHTEITKIINKQRFGLIAFIGLSATLNILAVLFVIVASSKGYVTFVNAITQSQPIFVLLLTILLTYLAPHLLKEEQSIKILSKKLVSIFLVVAGVILLII